MKKNIILKDKAIRKTLEYINDYYKETFVIKLTSRFLSNNEAINCVAKDIVLLQKIGISIIILHADDIEFNKIDLLYDNINQIEMKISGILNKKITHSIVCNGGNAIGISGKDNKTITARKIATYLNKQSNKITKIMQNSMLGEPIKINTDTFVFFEESNIIPVISTIACDDYGETCVADLDKTAKIVASTLAASKLIVISSYKSSFGKMLSDMDIKQINKLIKQNVIPNEISKDIEEYINESNNTALSSISVVNIDENSLLLDLFDRDSINPKSYK